MKPSEVMQMSHDIIDDVFATGFEFSSTKDVPSVDTSGLTYESGKDKKGKEIETCVLYVDIRDSVEMVKNTEPSEMAKIYTAFVKAVSKIAIEHGGVVRNIIGDRVMVLFPSEDCFRNSVECAVSINHVCGYIDSKLPYNISFRCGIGVDYGLMRVIKVGVERHGDENSEHKRLVWVGEAANIASRLTDTANKTLEYAFYDVSYNQYSLGLNSFVQRHIRLTPEELLSKIDSHGLSLGLLNPQISKQTEKETIPAILLTERVYTGYSAACPHVNDVTDHMWNMVTHPIDDVTGAVYGASLVWALKKD